MSKRAAPSDAGPRLKQPRSNIIPTLAEFADLVPTFLPKKLNDYGGAFVGIDVNGQWPCFAPVAAPKYMSLLHGKKRFSDASGKAGKPNVCLGMPEFHDAECTQPTDYKKHLYSFVDKVHAHVFENRVDYLGKKFAKYDEKMTKTAFSDAYKEADDGNPPFLRVVISDNKDPPVTSRKLKDDSGAWTAAKSVTTEELTAGCAIVPVIALFGGIWIVGERYGLKWGLVEALIFPNRSVEVGASRIPTSITMKEVADSDDEGGADESKPFVGDSGEEKFGNATYDGLP